MVVWLVIWYLNDWKSLWTSALTAGGYEIWRNFESKKLSKNMVMGFTLKKSSRNKLSILHFRILLMSIAMLFLATFFWSINRTNRRFENKFSKGCLISERCTKSLSWAYFFQVDGARDSDLAFFLGDGKKFWD